MLPSFIKTLLAQYKSKTNILIHAQYSSLNLQQYYTVGITITPFCEIRNKS